MNRMLSILFILVAAGALIAAGYFISKTTPDQANVFRGQVQSPDDSAHAPGWVDKGQSSTPDYSSAGMEAHNATPATEPTAPAPPDAEPGSNVVVEDAVVTFNFLELLTHQMLKGFSPGTAGRPAAITTTFRSTNALFGRSLDGFAVSGGDDIQAARRAVLDYVFRPAMLKQVYTLYAPVFIGHLTDTAMQTEREYTLTDGSTTRKALDNAETIAMLRLYAMKMERTAKVCEALASDPEITAAAGRYVRSTKAVDRANTMLQDALDTQVKSAEAGQRLKQAILQRESHKKEVVSRLRRACPSCESADLFAMGQWASRRAMENPNEVETFNTASAMLHDLSKRFEEQARKLADMAGKS